MNYKNILLYITFAILLQSASGCQQSQQAAYSQTELQTSASSAALPETSSAGKENFEDPASPKPSYIAGEVSFASGSWLLDDALVAGSKADAKNGSHSIRIRDNGKLSMQFDIPPTKAISIRHAVYAGNEPSSWQLWASTDQGKTYKQIDQTVTSTSHTFSTAFFRINVYQNIRFEIRKISGGKNRINLDDISFNATAHPANTPAAANTPPAASAGAPEKEAQPTITDQLLLGNPSGASGSTSNADNYLIDHHYYVESYSRSKACPNWVSWHIGSSDLGSTDRQDDFRPDTDLPEGWYEADNTSYRGSGFDKGHNCPSGDRTSSTAANSSTFLMNNMIPQAPNNNQHTWEHLESYCRQQVKKGNEVYVIMGTYGSGGTGKNGYMTTIDNGRINVPAHIWKVAVIIPEGENDLQRINAETRVIAVDTPNDNAIAPNWISYLCTVRDIEKATGYNLFSALPQSLQDVIEQQKFKNGN